MNGQRVFHCGFGILVWCATVASVSAGEAEETVSRTEMNTIATNAFAVVNSIPTVGLVRSAGAIERIMADHRRLSHASTVTNRHFSVVLADVVACAIITEVLRAENARRAPTNGAGLEAVGFDKETAKRLWKANVPDWTHLVRRALQGEGEIVSFVAEHSTEQEVLNGTAIQQIPRGGMRTRLSDLVRMASVPFGFQSSPSPDEHLVYVLTKAQAFRDLGIFMELYGRGDLPQEPSLLMSAIDGVLEDYPSRRLDDGMEMSSFKVWAKVTWLCPKKASPNAPGDEDTMRLVARLAPFMTDRSILPEFLRELWARMEAERSRSKRVGTPTPDGQ